MLFPASKREYVVLLILVVVAVNVILQGSVSPDTPPRSSEEEKILARIRAVRQEFSKLELAEELLKRDPANFAHPHVLHALNIAEAETGTGTGTNEREKEEDTATSSPPVHFTHPVPVPAPHAMVTDAPQTATAPPVQPAAPVYSGPTYDLVSSLPSSSTSTTTSSDNVLIVGGTDGSGTRRVVQLLTKLGVRVVSEDPETYDIHADLFGGWPEVVTPVLSASGSIVAAPESYPRLLQTQVGGALTRLLLKAAGDAEKPQSFRLAKGGALDRPKGTHASRVKYAFKAPVAMTLVPWWLQAADKLMFLHVLRDGRDIAFSANQGPVNKFFGPMYGKVKQGVQVPTGAVSAKAIKLWADWNNGLRVWAEEKMQQLAGRGKWEGKQQQFDYLAVRIEHLVDPSDVVRLDAIAHLAKFVGSDLDDDSLCCLAVEGSTFMGSHDRAGKIGASGDAQLKSKYGKWKSKFKTNPDLEKSLMKWGKEALSDLGYLQMEDNFEQIKIDFSKRMAGKYQCTLNKHQCAAKARGDLAWRSVETQHYTPPPSSLGASQCSFRDNVDFRGGAKMAVDISSLTTTAPDTCCSACVAVKECRFFTYVLRDHMCYLKRNSGLEVADDSADGLVSGAVGV